MRAATTTGQKALRIEDVPNPIIGKFYMVRTVFAKIWREHVPIYGPLHNDIEFLHFPDDHWHVDWRFASARLYQMKLRTRVMASDCFLHGVVISEANASLPPTAKVLQMKREAPSFPPAHQVPWLKKLEDSYEFHKLPKCKTCPHKGISLRHAKPDEHGIITCTGHGLSWHSQTGLLVRKT